ncbi:sensor histidine kinase [Streptomyces sp. NPDC093094]|uniref:sensor histidine kinase n=1 Tax=Streptomyces sp. NPDC093094 TaxID=3366026 RepID=UPI003816E522
MATTTIATTDRPRWRRPGAARTAAAAPAVAPPTPPLPIQVNAVQAMCRQVFGFRLAMIAVAAPAALLNASPGLGVRLVGAAVVVTFMGSYVLFRDWERFGPLLLRHPSLLVLDTVLGALLLVSAGPDTTLAYVSVCTPLLAGIVYGWRGAAFFASLQGLILLLVHAVLGPGEEVAESLLLPGLCVITGAVGSTLRNLMLRFGAATEALSATRARLAVTEAVSAERAGLARELHDSVAKTLHGVALAAEALSRTAAAPGADPAALGAQADLIARAARRAAAESRDLLSDLRRAADGEEPAEVCLTGELAARVADFAARSPLRATYEADLPAGLKVPHTRARHVATIVTEALDNAGRHARATRVGVRAEARAGVLRVTVRDDGRGLPPGTTLDALRHSGHFGLLGMTERAAFLGGGLRVGPAGDGDAGGTEVCLEVRLEKGPKTGPEPGPATDPAAGPEAPVPPARRGGRS